MASFVFSANDFEGWTVLQMVQKVLRGLGNPVTTPGTDTTSDYNRYPKQDIIDKLNEAQIEFVRKTNALTSFGIIEAVSGQATYRMPKNALKITDCKYYTGTSTYNQMHPKDRRNMKRVSITWAEDASGSPEYYYNFHSYGNIKRFGVYPSPSSSGTTFDGSSLGLVTTATDFTISADITGTHKTGYANSAFLVDSAGRDLTTLGASVGLMVFNTTDGSGAQITAIGDQDATNDKVTATLSGGTDNDWDVGDSFVIPAGEYGVVIRASGDEEWVFSSQLGALVDITPLSGNLLIDYVRRPITLTDDVQYPEISMDYQQALVDYSIWKLGSTEYNGFVMEKKAEQSKEAWFEAIADHEDFGDEDIEQPEFIDDRESRFFN